MSNLLFSWSELVDSAGRKVKEYKLNYDYHWNDVIPRICGTITEIEWNVFMFFAVSGGAFLSWVASPDWLSSLDKLYQNTVVKALGAVNPFVVGVAGFGVLMTFLMLDKVKSTSNRLDSQDMTRVATAIAILGGISVLVANPFMILKAALSVVQTIVASLADDDNGTMAAFSVDAMVRQPTLILSYGSAVSEKCARMWSETGSLSARSGCIEAGADNPGPGYTILGLMSMSLGFVVFLFSAVALWKFTKHLTTSVFGFVSIPWVASVSLFKRRQFDQLGKMFATASGHMIMVFIVQVISLGLPTLVSRVLHEWGQTDYAILQMMALIACYVVFTALLISTTSNTSKLTQALKTNATTHLNKMGSTSGGDYFGGGTSVRNALSQTFNPLAAYSSMRTSWDDIRNNNVFNKITRGKFAEKGDGDGDGNVRDDATDAQRTVSLGGRLKNVSTAVMGAGRFAIGWAKSRTGISGDEDDLALGTAPASNMPTFGPAVSPEPVVTVRAISSRVTDPIPDIDDTEWTDGSGDGAVFEADEVHMKDGSIISLKGDPSEDELKLRHYNATMMSDEPEYGGLTPQEIIGNVVDTFATKINDVRKGIDFTNHLLEDIRENGNESNSRQIDVISALHKNTNNMTMLRNSGIGISPEMTKLFKSLSDSSSGSTGAKAEFAKLAKAHTTSTDRMIALLESSQQRANAELARLGRGDGGDGEHAQRVQNVQINVSNDIKLDLSPAAVEGILRNALRGGLGTPGDVGITKLNHTCDRSEAEVVFEEAQMELLATGKGVQLAIPDTDTRFNVRFSPDRKGHIVSPAFDVGFGDSIF